MNRKNNTLLHTIAIAATFVAFLGLFATISIALTIIGIYWAFQLFFSVGWWAGLLVTLVVLAVYAASLSIALEYIERKTSK